MFQEGKVIISGTVTLGANPITIESGATLSINSSIRISASAGSVITIKGGTLEATRTRASAGSFVDVDQTIVLDGGGTLSYTTAGVLNIVQTTTTISGTGNLTKEGAGILAIASACSYTGATIINNGTLRMRTSTNRLPTGTDVTINSGGTFDPAVNTRVRSVNTSGTGKITFSLSGTLTINGAASFPSTISTAITDGSVFGSITKSGASTLTLTAVNDYNGTFTITAGTCTVDPGASLCAADCYLAASGGTLNLNNAAQTVDRVRTTGGTINLNSGHVLTIVQSGAGTNASRMQGTGSIIKQGANELVLTNVTSSYSGGTTVSLGTLVAASSSSLGQGNVTVANGATNRLSDASAMYGAADLILDAAPAAGTVDLNFTGTNFIQSLYFGATAQAVGTWGAVGSGAANENAAFTGTGFLQVRLPTTTAVTDDTGSPTVYGASVSFTATVTGSSPTGTVQFKDGASNLGSPVALSGGQAQISVSTLSVSGSPHSITAVYSGDDANAVSASIAVSHSVTKATLNVSANGTLTYGRDPSTNAVYAPIYYPLLNGDLPAVVTGNANFSTDATYTSYVGSNYIVSYVDAGTLAAANYDFAGGTNGIMTVIGAPLTVTNVAASDKVYDGTTNATIDVSGAGLEGFVNGDEASVTLDSTGAAASFGNKNAGVGKTVTFTGFATVGDLGTNYTVVQPTTTATISQTNITVTAATNTKPYDGNTSAAATPTLTAGSIQTGDTEPAWTETYDTANVGTGKTLTPAGTVIDGNGGANYSVSFVPDVTGVITAVSSATALVSSLNPSTEGDNVTFTATVSSGAGTPTGDVVFKTNGVTLATVALVGGVASAATVDLPVSTHSVSAEYAAQANWLASSDSLNQVVQSSVIYATVNEILSIVDNGDDTFDLTLKGTPGAQYYLVSSSDVAVALGSWTPVVGSTNTAPAAPGEWTFTASAAAPQYYRLQAVNPAP